MCPPTRHSYTRTAGKLWPSPPGVSDSGEVTITQNPDFVGTALVTVRVSDGAEFTLRSFDVTSTETPPSISTIGPDTIAHGAVSPTVDINTTNPDGATLTYGVNVTADNPLFDIKAQYGLTNPAFGFDSNLQSEYYFVSSNGSNAANSGLFVLGSNDKPIAWDGRSAITLGGTAVLDFTPYANVYDKPEFA